MTKPCTRHEPALFDSTNWADHTRARAICATCPHITACLQLALSIAGEHVPANRHMRGPDGTWAGMLWRDGKRVTRK